MTVSFHDVRSSYAEYVAFENSSNVRHEFLDGRIYAMAGGTPEHAALAMAFGGQLYAQLLGGPCRSYPSDLRILTRSSLATYPDLAVICGSPLRDVSDTLAATNPTMIVEVLSPSTEEYDTTEKFEHYKTLPSLQQYVLVSHRERAIEVWTGERSGTWQKTTVREGEIADLVLGLRLDVRELYDAAAVLPART
ncbi:MAG TPA: Uma2 family endonuclease [Thermoanaerobaculia bacterium]|nr:Uma2 family endonuclease [Thermoanaerobaculia bacterium]